MQYKKYLTLYKMFTLGLSVLCLFGRGPPPNDRWWYDQRIHNLGNIGLTGKIHAHMAKEATDLIDNVAYNGRNIRKELFSKIPPTAKVCDMGCGVGLSTHDNVLSVGLDTSDEMLEVAKRLNRDKLCKFENGNAITYGEDDEFDFCTISFLMHEAPQKGRLGVIRNAMRIASRGLLIVDIHPNYNPTKLMISGEPYVLDYLKNIRKDVIKSCNENGWYIHDLYTHIEDQVMVWALRPNELVNVKLDGSIIV